MKTSIFASSLVAAFLMTPVLASAQAQDTPANRPGPQGRPAAGQMRQGGNAQGRMGMGMGMGMMQQRQSMREALGLSDAQKADLRKVRETAQRDRLRKSTDFRIASMDLKSLLRAEKVDDKAVAAKLAEVQAAQGALLKVRVDTALAMKRVLTPEQQKKMGELRGHMRQGRMGQRMKMRGHMTMGGAQGGGQGQGRGRGRGRMGRPMGGGDDDPSDFDFDPDFDLDGDTSDIR